MKQSEKVLVGFMALAVLYGAFIFIPKFFKKTVDNQAANIAEVRDYITGLSERIKNQSPNDKVVFTINAAEAEWGADPFKFTEVPDKARGAGRTAADDQNRDELIYTGYLTMNKRKLAVINNVEYEAGDSLVGKDFKVKRIGPAEVVLESVPGGQEKIVNLKQWGD
jgi:hypothetical protein